MSHYDREGLELRIAMRALALAVYVCPRCAKRYTAPPGSIITCTHAGTRHEAFKSELAKETQQ